MSKLICADSSIAVANDSLPQNIIDAWSYTTTFAQAVARKVSADPSTEAYFNAMKNEYPHLAWNVIEATKVNYSQQATRITPAEIVKSILNPYLTPDQQKQIAGVLDIIKDPDTGVKNFLTFWHNKAHIGADQSSLAMGLLTEYLNAPAISMVYYSFNFAADDERWLFVEKESADLGVHAYYLKMNMNLDFYNNVIKSAIETKITPVAQDHIASVPVDL